MEKSFSSRAGPTYSHVLDCGRVESQIDHVLCDEGVAPALGEEQVLPGLSDNDHKWLEVSLLRRVDAHEPLSVTRRVS